MLTPSVFTSTGSGKSVGYCSKCPAFSFIVALVLFIQLQQFSNVGAQGPATIMIDARSALETNYSLQYHLCGEGTEELASDTLLQLSGGVHYLQEGPFCLLQNLENFTIQGQGRSQPRTVIHCRGETETRRGFAFFNVSNLHLFNLDIVNCGREVPSELAGYVNNTFTYLGLFQKAVLIITHSINAVVKDVSVDRCQGFGMLFINTLGNATIEEVSVTGTTSQDLRECTQPLKRSDMHCSGSGVVVVFSDSQITDNLMEANENYTTSSFIITNSYFVNNTNWIPADAFLELYDIFDEAYTTERILMTGALSLAVYIGQRGYFVDVKIINTSILSNTGNTANFIVLHYNAIHTSTTGLEGMVISDNKVGGSPQMSVGGGLMVLVIVFFDSLNSFPKSHGNIYDLVEIRHSNFSHNWAYSGGGVMFFVSPQNVSNIRLVVRDTAFTNNVANNGAALYVIHSPSLVYNQGAYIYMEDVVASGNTFLGAHNLDNSPENSGVFLIGHSFNLTLMGTKGKGCFFRNNHISVVMAVRTNVVLQGYITFNDNHGYRGGALNLVESSILFIHNESDITFTRNRAFREGGAVYINTRSSAVSFTCAIQFVAENRVRIDHKELKLLNLSIVFSNNNALVAGNSIFARNLYYCAFLPVSAIVNTNRKYLKHNLLYKEVFDFKQTVGNERSEINSVEEIICICPNATFAREDCGQFRHSLGNKIIPGSTFELFLNPVDAVGTPVASLLYSFPRSTNLSDHVELDVLQNVRSLPGLIHCSSVGFRIFAPENITLFIDLSATIGGRKVTVEISTTSCPPGFVLYSDDGHNRLSCLCSEFIQNELKSTCNITAHTISRPTSYWVGTSTGHNGGLIIQFVSTCPTNYCRKDITDIDLRVPDQLCVAGRTGTLCGACSEGLSSVFGTPECRRCSNAWLATLPLFALIGILVVVAAFLIDITITHGLINGLFFYSNIVTVNANIFFQGNHRGFLFWFLSWVNLDIGFPLCFYDGMTESAKLGLQYVFPTYIIFIIAFIIIVSQHSIRMQRIISQLDGIHVLVSMFYISFLKVFRTVIDTVTFVSIVTEGEKEEGIVWFFDGTHKISDPISVFFILLGSVTLACFILPYMVFFTFSTYIQQRVNSTRLNAYVDASLAPYKNKQRFWFGVRLILISAIYVIIANRGTNNPTLTLTLELSLLVGFALIQTYTSPFKSLGVAFIDLSFLLNLIALTLGTSYTIQNKARFHDQDIIVNLSLSVAALTYVGIIVWHIMRKLHKNKWLKEKVRGAVARFIKAPKLRKARGIMEMMAKIEGRVSEREVPQDEGEYSTGHSDLQTSTSGTTTMTLQDMVAAPDEGVLEEEPELREPVLEFLNKGGKSVV